MNQLKIKETGVCEVCNENFYGDDFGAVGHRCLIQEAASDFVVNRCNEKTDPIFWKGEMEVAFLAGVKYAINAYRNGRFKHK